jgi:putative protease
LDAALFEFGRTVQCACGQWVDMGSGHLRRVETGLFPVGQTILSASPSSPCKESTMPEQQIGRVTHYFSKIQVAAIEITEGLLRVGDTIRIKGHTSDFTQTVDSMQIDNKPVQEAIAGQTIGLKVKEHARPHDIVYKVEP